MLRPAGQKQSVAMLGQELNLRLDCHDSVFAGVIKTCEFVFTERDFTALSEYKEPENKLCCIYFRIQGRP